MLWLSLAAARPVVRVACELCRKKISPSHRMLQLTGARYCQRNIRWFVTNMRQMSRAEAAAACATYGEAVEALNTLQSNAATLEKIKAERDRKRHLSLPQTIEDASRAGISMDDINTLSVIHVSGTKGKGSTCAFTESILRHHGYKTGFFSSPHLVEVRERIRINGKPLSREAFTVYFWDVYKKLDATKDAFGGSMPAYFRFLTIMAFHVFLQEKVDVSVLEVGIGGEYDCTNIVRHPVVCGVSSLGIDHTSLLGDTIDKIAWHKAGIFKPGVPAVTVVQPENSIEVLKDRALEVGCPLYLVPRAVTEYDGAASVELGIPGEMQSLNASLAVHLSHIWMQDQTLGARERSLKYQVCADNGGVDALQPAKTPRLTEKIITGLRECRWLGRSQTLCRPGTTFYLDGAHTPRSIEACVNWFSETSSKQATNIRGRVSRVLIFNMTGDRQPQTLLRPLTRCNFDFVLFCPNIIRPVPTAADQMNFMVTADTQLSKCVSNRNTWLWLLTQPAADITAASIPHSADTASSPAELRAGADIVETRAACVQNGRFTSSSSSSFCKHSGMSSESGSAASRSGPSEISNGTGADDKYPGITESKERTVDSTHLFSSIAECLQWLSQARGNMDAAENTTNNIGVASQHHDRFPEAIKEAEHVQVLCTGSLHLIGGLLAVLEPNIND